MPHGPARQQKEQYIGVQGENLREKHTRWDASTRSRKRGTPTKRRKRHICIYIYIYCDVHTVGQQSPEERPRVGWLTVGGASEAVTC
jgi:hypothetical protein